MNRYTLQKNKRYEIIIEGSLHGISMDKMLKKMVVLEELLISTRDIKKQLNRCPYKPTYDEYYKFKFAVWMIDKNGNTNSIRNYFFYYKKSKQIYYGQ